MMSFSKALYDGFFDIAHIYKLLGYTVPLLGFLLYQIALVSEREKVGQEMQKAIEQLRNRARSRHSPLKDTNELLYSKTSESEKDKEEKIKALKRQLEFILGITKTGLDIIDSDFNIRYIDPERQKLYGDPAARKCYEYFMDRNKVCPGCGVVKALKTKQITVTEKVLVRENNRPAQVTTIPFQSEQGEWLAAEVNIDISERKKMEEELKKYRSHLEELINRQTLKLTSTNKKLDGQIRQKEQIKQALQKSDELFNIVLDSISNGIMIVNKQFLCTHWNRPMERLFGIPKEQATSKKVPVWELFNIQTAGRIRQSIQKALQGRLIRTENIPYALQNGRCGYTTEIFIPCKSQTGETHSIVGIIRDVTAHRFAENALENMNEQLEVTVENISRSNHELQNLIKVTTNDLTGHLRAIGNLITWISKDYSDRLNGQGQKNIELLNAKAQQLNIVINNALKFADIKRNEKKEKQVDLNRLLTEVIDEIKPSETSRIVIENKLPVLIGEKRHIKEVFSVILKKALENIDGNTGQIKVGCLEEDSFWRFSIADNGPELVKDYQQQIFDMPQTLSPRDVTEQTRISFSTVRAIVQMYNGNIWLESNSDKGNVVHFTMPKKERRLEDEKLETRITH